MGQTSEHQEDGYPTQAFQSFSFLLKYAKQLSEILYFVTVSTFQFSRATSFYLEFNSAGPPVSTFNSAGPCDRFYLSIQKRHQFLPSNSAGPPVSTFQFSRATSLYNLPYSSAGPPVQQIHQ